jgi:hypothetical protein
MTSFDDEVFYQFYFYNIILPNKMTSRVEQLPIELWISIFSYLEAHDLFEAFTNLNSYFDYLLASNHLQFNIIFRRTDSKLFGRPSILNTDDSILNRTISLTFGWKHHGREFCQFLRFNIDQFTHLQSLTINKLPNAEIPFISVALQKLKSLRYLSLRFTEDQSILDAILAAPNLIVCQLFVVPNYKSVYYTSAEISNIQRLSITCGNYHFVEILHQLLTHMPKLKSLEVLPYGNEQIYFREIFVKQFFVLERLEIFKLMFNFCPIGLNYFKGLFNTMPVLRRFYLTVKIYNKNVWKDVIHSPIYCLLKSLIDDLWTILEKLQQVIVTIQCCSVYTKRLKAYETRFVSDCEEISATIYAHTGVCFQIQNIENHPLCCQLQMTISKH